MVITWNLTPRNPIDLVFRQIAQNLLVVRRHAFTHLHQIEQVILGLVSELQTVIVVQVGLNMRTDVSDRHKIWPTLILNDGYAFVRIQSQKQGWSSPSDITLNFTIEINFGTSWYQGSVVSSR